jgi:hypothetical protein
MRSDLFWGTKIGRKVAETSNNLCFGAPKRTPEDVDLEVSATIPVVLPTQTCRFADVVDKSGGIRAEVSATKIRQRRDADQSLSFTRP